MSVGGKTQRKNWAASTGTQEEKSMTRSGAGGRRDKAHPYENAADVRLGRRYVWKRRRGFKKTIELAGRDRKNKNPKQSIT